jgi:hypothetical protein
MGDMMMMSFLPSALAALPLCAAHYSPADIHVPGDHPTIAEAVAAATEGDTILIEAGTYRENNIFPSVPNLTIIGAVDADGFPAATIDGEGSANILIGIGVVGSNGVTLENIHFTGSLVSPLWIYQSDPVIRNCEFSDNTSTSPSDAAAVWASSSEALFESCRFFDNDAGQTGNIINLKGVTGLLGSDHGSPTFLGCAFEGNSSGHVVSTRFWDANFEQCAFLNNTAASVLSIHQGVLTMTENLLCSNTGTPIEGGWSDGGDNQFVDQCPGECQATNYCAASPNTVGAGVQIDITGTPSIALNSFGLDATGGPPSQAGLFFHGPGTANQPFGEGVRCVSTPIMRVTPPIFFSSFGTASKQLNMNATALSNIQPADTRYFQLWYRDPAGGPFGFNLSNGLAITFCP